MKFLTAREGQKTEMRKLRLDNRPTPPLPSAEASSVDRLQFLPWLETYGFAGRNGNLGPGAGISPNSGFPWPDVKYAEAAQLNAIALGEGAFHTFKHGFDGQLSLGFRYSGFVNHFVDNVQLDHGPLPAQRQLTNG
jgi:hypothetical protein